MRVPVSLSNAFLQNFDTFFGNFLVQHEYLPDLDSLQSKRFLTRSVAPHVKTLSNLFNRREGDQTDGIDHETYFSDGANPANRRLAYFMSFMPCNVFRVASVWAELHRLGWKWPFLNADFRGIEFGAGTASGACGIMLGEQHARLGLPSTGSFALIEQSRTVLDLGTKWFDAYSEYLSTAEVPSTIRARPFHRKIDLSSTWLPPSAPKFQIMVMSFFLNESPLSSESLARQFVKNCEKHLEDEGVVIIVEPAMKLQSRKLLEFRKALLEVSDVKTEKVSLKVLLPCLGHQTCGALSLQDDWCHEEVGWWRPLYLRQLDSMVGLDRKTLPFSYLVIQKSKRTREELLPTITGPREQQYRLVSPSHALGRDHEFYLCGVEGKRKSRFRVPENKIIPNRGDILTHAQIRGELQLSQIDSALVVQPVTESSEELKE
jgi:hypothetical protein